MIKNYIKIAWRNIARDKKSTFINVLGLSLGMAIVMLIELWIRDELSFDHYHENHKKIGQLYQSQTLNDEVSTFSYIPRPLEQVLRTEYASLFKYIVMSSVDDDHMLSFVDKHISSRGGFMGGDIANLLSLEFIAGNAEGLRHPHSILLNESTAIALFGDQNPIGKVIKIDQRQNVKVTGVYKDLPLNTTFTKVAFISPWDLYTTADGWVKNSLTQWDNNSFECFVQLQDNMTFAQVNAQIKDAKYKHVPDNQKMFKATIMAHPMDKWHLYSKWENGKLVGGGIEYVRMFTVIGFFVLLLSCINFMNLSTARSERRAKEVGVRKTLGTSRNLLIGQFLTESLLVALFSFFSALAICILGLPVFNEIVEKDIHFPIAESRFWLAGMALTLITGLIAGSYPAFYLSSFQPLKVLKGTFKGNSSSNTPRQALIVFQFTISIALVIGTIIVFNQIQHTKKRNLGYDKEQLVMLKMSTPQFYGKYDVLRDKLKQIGAVSEMAESSAPMTAVWTNSGGFDWEGRDPNLISDFATNYVSHEFGKTIGWQIVKGRDFSRTYSTDTSAVIVNETLVKFAGLKDPVGKILRHGDHQLEIVGVVKDLLVGSPYQSIKQTIYFLDYENVNWMLFKLNGNRPIDQNLEAIKNVLAMVVPDASYDFSFVDQGFADKFQKEEQIAKSAVLFTVFALIISCLGIFGLASYFAEQRTKEIGIRKVIGASVLQLWLLLSKDFLKLVTIACVIASPIAYWLLHNWLQQYTYRIEISWWIFALTGLITLALTILVVSFQTIRAANANPVDSLRDE